MTHSRTPLAAISDGLAFVLADPRLDVPDSLKRQLLDGHARAAVVADSFARRLAERTGTAFAPQVRWYSLIAFEEVQAGRPDSALAVLRGAVAVYPERLDLLLQLADFARRQGDHAAAARAFVQARGLVRRLEDLSDEARARLAAEVSVAETAAARSP